MTFAVTDAELRFASQRDRSIDGTDRRDGVAAAGGIDVFASEFPKERGYGVYEGPNASLLVIKLEEAPSRDIRRSSARYRCGARYGDPLPADGDVLPRQAGPSAASRS